jgi:thiamine pyrophosphokinase
LINKHAVIFANGEVTDINRLGAMLQPDDVLIAADGGLHYLIQLGKWPQVLIGDLDSVNSEVVNQAMEKGVEVRRFPVHKNETDLQLAIEYAIHTGCISIVIAGALGGRLDQTLGNIFLLTRPDLDDFDIRLDDGKEEVFFIHNQAAINGHPGDIVSLIPYGEPVADVKTQSLKYPLDFETLYPDKTRGISNVMESCQAHVSISSGLLICIHTRQPLPVH